MDFVVKPAPADTVALSAADRIATITLNRPAKRNALTEAMLGALLTAFDDLDRDAGLRVVVVRGAGDAFCSGIDLDEMRAHHASSGVVNHSLLEHVLDRLDRHRNPTIAVVHGPALAGGCELALHCDIRIGSPAARLGMPLARIGIVVPYTLAQRLVDIVGGPAARDLLLTGEVVDGTRAYELGMLTRFEREASLWPSAAALASRIAANAPLAVRQMKVVTRRALRAESCDDPDLERERLRISRSDDVREGLKAFAERRTPEFRGV